MWPKYVVVSAIIEDCLCIYCANLYLFLPRLIILRGSKSKTSEFNEIRLEIINAITCSKPSDLDFQQECKICPQGKGITYDILKIQNEEDAEETSTEEV